MAGARDKDCRALNLNRADAMNTKAPKEEAYRRPLQAFKILTKGLFLYQEARIDRHEGDSRRGAKRQHRS